MSDPSQIAAASATVGARLCVGLVFIAAALPKLRQPRELEGVIANFRILTPSLQRPVARGLPILELLVGSLLVTGFQDRLASAVAAALLLGFAWAMGLNLRRGRNHIDCGCHGATMTQTLSWLLVWRNVGLAVLAIGATLADHGQTLPATVVGLVLGAMLFLLYLIVNALTAMPPLVRTTA